MRNVQILLVLCCSFWAAGDLRAEDHGHAHHAVAGAASQPRDRADAHAPIGVMGDHLHPAGGIMLSYRFMRMGMDGNRDGRERRSSAAVLVAGGPLRGHRFALEVGRPLYQWLDGPQLETDWLFVTGWQYAF